jgi:hypothetical protein
VAGVSDQHHAAADAAQARHFHMHLGHQWAGGIEHFQPALIGLFAHRLRDAVSAENHRGTIGHFMQLFDENRAVLTQFLHHVAVVNHFVAHVDGRTPGLQRALDNGDGAIDAGAESAGVGEQDVQAGPRMRL